LADALTHLPKCFEAQGLPGKVHKVRVDKQLDSEECGLLVAGDHAIVVHVDSTVNTKGEEVDRFEIRAPFVGWITASNFRLAPKMFHQTKDHFRKVERKLSSKDKKTLKKREEERKKKAHNDLKDAEKAKRAEEKRLKEAKIAGKAAAKKAKEDAKKAKKKGGAAPAEPPPAAAESQAGEEQEGAEPPKSVVGKWKAKGSKDVHNKVRAGLELGSKEVGKVVGGQEVQVAEEATAEKSDGSAMQRLRITAPKVGWITAQNFEQL